MADDVGQGKGPEGVPDVTDPPPEPPADPEPSPEEETVPDQAATEEEEDREPSPSPPNEDAAVDNGDKAAQQDSAVDAAAEGETSSSSSGDDGDGVGKDDSEAKPELLTPDAAVIDPAPSKSSADTAVSVAAEQQQHEEEEATQRPTEGAAEHTEIKGEADTRPEAGGTTDEPTGEASPADADLPDATVDESDTAPADEEAVAAGATGVAADDEPQEQPHVSSAASPQKVQGEEEKAEKDETEADDDDDHDDDNEEGEEAAAPPPEVGEEKDEPEAGEKQLEEETETAVAEEAESTDNATAGVTDMAADGVAAGADASVGADADDADANEGDDAFDALAGSVQPAKTKGRLFTRRATDGDQAEAKRGGVKSRIRKFMGGKEKSDKGKEKELEKPDKGKKKHNKLKRSVSEPVPDDRSIRTTGKVGGFTETVVPVHSDAARMIKDTKNAGSFVSLKFSDDQQSIVADANGSCKTSAAGVREILHPDEPRYYVVMLGKRRTFVYCCPSSSARKNRMLYATSKSQLVTQLKKLGVATDNAIEISDPDDLTDDMLKGKAPSHNAPPPKELAPTSKPAAIVPGLQKGSLGGFMAQSLGQAKPKKKIVMPPPGAYC